MLNIWTKQAAIEEFVLKIFQSMSFGEFPGCWCVEEVGWKIDEKKEQEREKNKKFNWMFKVSWVHYSNRFAQAKESGEWGASASSLTDNGELRENREMKNDIPIREWRNVKYLSFFFFFLEFPHIFSFVQLFKIFKSRTSLKASDEADSAAAVTAKAKQQ